MASNTPNLNLHKKDPATDGNDTFNIKTMLNDNWDKIDTAVKQVQDELDNISVPAASTTQAGIVQLTNATNSTSETMAPTAKALKSVADASLPKTGGTISSDLAVKGSISTIGNVYIRKNDQLGSAPAISLAIGDSDTGLDWKRDGALDFYTNNWPAAYIVNEANGASRGLWARVSDASNTAYHVADEIKNLKQSGVNAKDGVVSALNAKNIAVSTSSSWSELAQGIKSIKPVTKEGNVVRHPDSYVGSDGLIHYQFVAAGNSSKTWTLELENFPYTIGYAKLKIDGFVAKSGSSTVNGSSFWIDIYNRTGADDYINPVSSSRIALLVYIDSYVDNKLNLTMVLNQAAGWTFDFRITSYRAAGI